jgi:hypothetical protein
MLHSVPSPSGLRPETDEVDLNPEWPWGYRKYRVDGEHSDIVGFLIAELPLTDWDLVKHDSGRTQRESDAYLKFDDMLFTNRQRYWLIVEAYSNVDAKGIQNNNTLVILEIYRDGELANSRYLSPSSSPTPHD